MPPSTTIARIVADSMKVKLSGLMKPCRVAKKQPAKPPNIAPIAKADSLTLVGLMPSARQAISSSRSASQARPTGSLRMRNVKKLVISASDQDQVIEKDDPVVGRELDPEQIGEGHAAVGRAARERQAEKGRPRHRQTPFGPPVTVYQFSSTMRTISPKPSVTIAR